MAVSLNQLAELYRNQGKYAEAEPLYQRALAVSEKTLGPEHPQVAMVLNNLAVIYEAQRRYAEVESFYRRALLVLKKAVGADHPEVAKMSENYTGFLDARVEELYRQGKYAEATPLAQEAPRVAEAIGSESPQVALAFHNLALLYQAQGNYAEAEQLYRRALFVLTKAVGPEHPNVATMLENYAVLLRNMQRNAEAEKMEARAQTIRAKHAQENPQN